MRTPLVAGNWKMFKTIAEAVAHVRALRDEIVDLRGVEVIVAPPFTAIRAAADAASGSAIGIAAQNLHWEREGPFTGEVSAPMIREAGARYVIVGHSERRALFGETNLAVNRKIGAALAAGLTPIVCVGETLDEREAGKTEQVIDAQLNEGLDRLGAPQIASLVIAYEPVWAIGTGRNATPEQAQQAHAHIRGRLRQWFGAERAERCRVIYGGSVKPDNARGLLEQPDVDGALVGGASLDAAAFAAIARAALVY
jgi:triosephosphate isomerase